MSSSDPIDFMFSIISGIFWLVMLIVWLSFMSTVKQRLAALEEIARRQTAALEKIARHLVPPTPDEKPAGRSTDRYVVESRSASGKVLLLVIGGAFVLLLLAVLLRK